MSYSEVFKGSTFVKPVGHVHINLSMSPDARWGSALAESASFINVNAMISDTRQHVDELLCQMFIIDVSSTTQSWIGRLLRYLLFAFMGLACRLFCEYAADIVALASLLHIPTGELFLANALYETFGCTSFVCTDISDPAGRPMLCRTLDWPFTDLAKYTLQFHWMQHNKVVFQSVGWMGFVGVMTAVKPGCFAVALNARYPEIGDYAGIDTLSGLLTSDPEARMLFSYILKSTLRKISSMCCLSAWSSGSVIRYCFEHYDKYEDVVTHLSYVRLVAPCYFIIAGADVNQGAVVSRDAGPMLGIPIAAMAEHGYVVQTNHDNIDATHTAGLPPEDFNSIDRFYCVSRLLQQQHHLTPAEAAKIMTKSINSGVGVRMKMSLYCCVMRPHHEVPLVAARMSRSIGM